MHLTAGLDSGPVCLLEREPIAADDDYGDALRAARAARCRAACCGRSTNDPTARSRTSRSSTYAEKISATDRTLDPLTATAEELARVVRALTPHVGARLPLPDGSFLGVVGAQPAAGVALPAGTLAGEGGRLLLGCRGDSVLELVRVQPPGGRAMPATDYLRGRAI